MAKWFKAIIIVISLLVVFDSLSKIPKNSFDPIASIPVKSIPANAISECLDINAKQVDVEALSAIEKLKYAENGYQMCKYALAQNNEKFPNNKWKDESWSKLAETYTKYNISKSDLEGTMSILDKLMEKGRFLETVKKNQLNDLKGSNETKQELKSILKSYRFYCDYSRQQDDVDINNL